MEIKISKRDAMHTLNWLNAFKDSCKENGMGHLCGEIDDVRKRIWEECQQHFPKAKMLPQSNNQISYMTGDDMWWCEPKYSRK